MKKKISSVLVSLLFFVWILPLGVFIKLEQEEKACNGQRAICLCSHLLAKQMARNAGKTFLKVGGTSIPKEHSGSGGASHPFLTAQKKTQENRQSPFYDLQQSSHYSLLVIRPIEHVPKT